jgi:hypothetical protein
VAVKRTSFLEINVFKHGYGWNKFYKFDDLFREENKILENNSIRIYWQIEKHFQNRTAALTKKMKTFLKSNLGLKTGQLTDFNVEVNGKLYPIHKSYFAEKSLVFRDMFVNTDYGDNKLVIKVISTEIFEEILLFMNTGIAPNIEKYSSELMCDDVKLEYFFNPLTDFGNSFFIRNLGI